MNQNRTERENYTIPKGKVLIFGDIHLTNKDIGRHKNYEKESLETITRIEKIVREEKPVAIFFLGDLIGYRDTVLQHGDFFTKVLNFFIGLNKATNGRVFTVKGNHDIAPRTDFDTLDGIDLIKVPNYVDCENVRYHFVNYGEEYEPLDIPEDNNITNVVLGHNFYLPDTYYDGYGGKGEPILVPELKNMAGIKMIITGHIHGCMDDTATTILDGKEVFVYYTGSFSRSASNDKHETSTYIRFEYLDNSDRVSYTIEPVQLTPLEEILIPKEKILDAETADKVKEETIKEVVEVLAQRKVCVLDFKEQIDKLPAGLFSDEAMEYTKNVLAHQVNKDEA